MRSPFVNINLGLHLGLSKILFWYHYTSKQETPVKRCRKVPTIDSSLPAWIRRACAVYERMLLWVPRSGQTGISLPLTWNPSGSRLLRPVPASWLSAGLATACSCRSPCEPGTGCNILKCNSNLSLHCWAAKAKGWRSNRDFCTKLRLRLVRNILHTRGHGKLCISW